ncbi:fasciclin-1 isoform X3 [Glossina fuscipes]|uniref:Fasciclin-1 isoform X3 n=1 Tax=Glossina fuscipes TaxID=7396 RepID=A0A9C6DTU8_9MUSC|nr:fasciclin-1 isoform X3 [Glossina fuscipes]
MCIRSSSGDWGVFVQTLIISCFIALIQFTSASLLDKLQNNYLVSDFHELIRTDPVANSTLQLRSCTLFVPTNAAVRKYNGTILVSYHMATVPMTVRQLTKTIPSDFEGNPLLYITRNRKGEVYVNNAWINQTESTEIVTQENKRQVMHVINDVLVPLTLLPTARTQVTNPNAWEFLQQSDLFDVQENRLRTYRSQVTLMRKESLYQSPGGHTFFIPVDEGFKQTTRSSLVDRKVIDGHVILNSVLFSAAQSTEDTHTTAAFEDNIKVTVNFYYDNDKKLYVKSNTLVGDSKHSTGVVLAQVLKANIPVSNGVVHLIHRPLMIVDTTVKQFLESLVDNKNGALRRFYEVIMEIGGEVLDDINSLGDVTILAPSNEAWNASNIENIIGNREKMRDIVNMHIIKGRVDVEKIKQSNENMIGQFPTIHSSTFLYFNVNGDDTNEVVTVEGGGVNATIIVPDIAQTNGFVHIIDRVLGVPYTTVLGKLETDPMLSDTYRMGQFSSFNDQLNNTQRRFTYFVPRDRAWQKTQYDYPSVYKKLFMKDFAYHSRCIMERHLLIADDIYTMKTLAEMTKKQNDSIILPTFRDSLKIKVEEEVENLHDDDSTSWTGYVILWNYKRIRVFRPDVECTNGIIHVIDYPMLEKKDIVVSGGSYQLHSNFCIVFANFIILAIAKNLF